MPKGSTATASSYEPVSTPPSKLKVPVVSPNSGGGVEIVNTSGDTVPPGVRVFAWSASPVNKSMAAGRRVRTWANFMR
jgi:hypothetical protein